MNWRKTISKKEQILKWMEYELKQNQFMAKAKKTKK
jgi:hypothetical protein